ncbi:hypothetical protein [Hymenobacter volaticus]|nr:hypothetical protein [Hymenobacter volaticus]
MLEAFDKPTAPMGSAEDPFNYAVQANWAPVAGSGNTLADLQQAFPGLPTPEASRVQARADALGRQALHWYYQVRDEQLSEAEAEARIKTAYPELSAANFSVLRARCHIATSK